MIKKLSVFLLVFVLAFAANTFAYESLEAVCKVHAGNSLGTGTCVDIHGGTAFVFTNYHVAGGPGSRVTCQFYNAGHESVEIPGKVVWAAFQRNGNTDQSMIALDLSNLGGYKPKVLKFGDPSKQLTSGQTVLTVGCPEGKWPALVKGHVIRNNGGVYYIKPPVENGRSGSALIDDETKTIVGIITWRSGDNYNGVGMAQDLQTIYRAMSNQSTFQTVDYSDFKWTKYDNGTIFWPANKYAHLPEVKPQRFYYEIQCPDGGCLPYGFGQNPRPYQENEPYGYNGNPYPNGGRLFPTLPQNPNDETFPDQQDNLNNYCEEKFKEFNESLKELSDSTAEGLTTLNDKVDGVANNLNNLTGKVDSLEGRVKSLEDAHRVTPGDIHDKIVELVPGMIHSSTEDKATKEELKVVIDSTQNLNAKLEKNTTDLNEKVDGVSNAVQNVTGKVDELTVQDAETVGLETSDWVNLITMILGGGGATGVITWFLNRGFKKLQEALGGAGGPQVPFQTSRNR